MNRTTIVKLLDRAGHPGTSDHEALSAVRKAYRLLPKGFSDLTANVDAAFLAAASRGVEMASNRATAAEAELTEANRLIAILRRDHALAHRRAVDMEEAAERLRVRLRTARVDLKRLRDAPPPEPAPANYDYAAEADAWARLRRLSAA